MLRLRMILAETAVACCAEQDIKDRLEELAKAEIRTRMDLLGVSHG